MTLDPAPLDPAPAPHDPAAIPPAPPGPARPPEPGGTGSSVGLALGAAFLSALLASAGTTALLLATAPGAAPAPSPVATAVTTIASPTPVAADVVLDVGDAIAAVAAATEPMVVTITLPGFGGNLGGSGVVITADGLILTTTVVAATDDVFDITLADTRTGTGRVVAVDQARGLVLLRTSLTGLVPARLAAGAGLNVGQRVIAIGSPLGDFNDTVTAGIVSSLGRSIDLRDPSTGRRVALDGLIQTDAAINAGSSGGALLDIEGAVVGIIATSAIDGQGIGFAIPIDAAADLLAQARS